MSRKKSDAKKPDSVNRKRKRRRYESLQKIPEASEPEERQDLAEYGELIKKTEAWELAELWAHLHDEAAALVKLCQNLPPGGNYAPS